MTSSISFLEFAKMVLSNSSEPMSADEIWNEGVKQHLNERLNSTGKTPAATLGARLYTAALKKQSTGITGIGSRPRKFILSDPSKGSQNIPVQPMAQAVKKSSSSNSFSFAECAKKVLEQYGGKKPMHYKDITTKAQELGWLNSDGLTPEASMYAQILTEIQRSERRGELSIFVKHGHGFVGLRRWLAKGLSFQIDEYNKEINRKLLEYLRSMDATKFERLIGNLLATMGYEDLEVTQRSNDGGIDVKGTKVLLEGVRIKMAIQAKRWKKGNNVQRPAVQALRGSLPMGTQGVIITTSDFPKSARDEAEDPTKSCPISLINGEQLVSLLVECGMGIKKKTVDILELDTNSISDGDANEEDIK